MRDVLGVFAMTTLETNSTGQNETCPLLLDSEITEHHVPLVLSSLPLRTFQTHVEDPRGLLCCIGKLLCARPPLSGRAGGGCCHSASPTGAGCRCGPVGSPLRGSGPRCLRGNWPPTSLLLFLWHQHHTTLSLSHCVPQVRARRRPPGDLQEALRPRGHPQKCHRGLYLPPVPGNVSEAAGSSQPTPLWRPRSRSGGSVPREWVSVCGLGFFEAATR